MFFQFKGGIFFTQNEAVLIFSSFFEAFVGCMVTVGWWW
jgi:hypothetical protein